MLNHHCSKLQAFQLVKRIAMETNQGNFFCYALALADDLRHFGIALEDVQLSGIKLFPTNGSGSTCHVRRIGLASQLSVIRDIVDNCWESREEA